MDISKMARNVVSKFNGEFPDGSRDETELKKYQKHMTTDVQDRMKNAEVQIHRPPKGAPPSSQRKHLDPEEEPEDLKKIEAKLVKLSASLEGLARGVIEEMDRISKDDKRASEEGDHMFIDEKSGLERRDALQGGREILPKKK